MLLQEIGDYKGALVDLHKLLEKRPNDIQIIQEIANIYINCTDEPEKGEEMLTRCIQHHLDEKGMGIASGSQCTEITALRV